ncbi:MAG: AAA family ATPase [candidate division WOR-3 bacterium]
MRIKQLILNGFKSFPEKTSITFDPYINAIVGPNGCGKTNILDGLRWVMGESSFTQMRCGKTEDLIFSGNPTHPPDNFAEVTLILENNQPDILSSQPIYNLGSEVEIKRRFYRSGESEFFINRKPCKLKDIQDLFTSGGGSGHSYSIFDLPKMRQIISSDLKEMFIEAAGLAFYHERKQEIERKLKLTSDDLLRLNDIINERTRITRSLKRQAYRLMAFEKVKEHERRLMIALMRFDYQKLCEDEANINETLSKLDSEIKALEAEIAEIESNRSNLRKILQEKQSVRDSLQMELEQTKEQLITSEERLKSLLEQRSYFESEQEKINNRKLALANSQLFASVDSENIQNTLIHKTEYFNQMKALLERKEKEFNELRQKNKELEHELFTEQLAYDELLEKDKHIFLRFSQLTSDIATIETKINDLSKYQKTLEDSISALLSLKPRTVKVNELKNIAEELFADDFLGCLNELIIAKPGYEQALQSVLHKIYDAIIIKSALKLSEILPKANTQTTPMWLQDKLVTIVADENLVAETELHIDELVNRFPGGKLFRDCVEIKPGVPNFVQSIINSYILVENFSDIVKLINNSEYRKLAVNFVTKSGIAFANNGLLIIPAYAIGNNLAPSLESPTSELENKLQILQKELDIIKQQQEHYEKDLSQLLKEKELIEKEKEQIGLVIIKKQENINQKRKLNKEYLEQASNFLFDINKSREELSHLQAELDELHQKQNLMDTILADEAKVNETLLKLATEVELLKEQIDKLSVSYQEKKAIFEQTEIGQLTKEYERLEAKINEIRTTLDLKKKDFTDWQLQKKDIVNKREQIEQQANALLVNGITLLKSTESPIGDINEIKKELASVQKKINAIGQINPLAKDEYDREQQELNRLIRQRDDIILAQNNLNSALSQLTEKAEEIFRQTLAQVQTSFRRIFKEIFIEGEADLILVTPSKPLESEIKIIAQPKGKIPKRLDQLSDGEKALLALSLLFAFYDIKPAPFCFMDEVDAPLDDANVKRFTNFLKRIAKTTQIIIITHNKLTIESANVVIGVTTEEPGISKIVSVRFKDFTEKVSAQV